MPGAWSSGRPCSARWPAKDWIPPNSSLARPDRAVSGPGRRADSAEIHLEHLLRRSSIRDALADLSPSVPGDRRGIVDRGAGTGGLGPAVAVGPHLKRE